MSEDLTTTWTKDAGVTITADSSQGQPFSAAQVFRVNYTGANQAGPIQGTAYLAAPYAASVWIKGTPGETIRFTGQTTVAAADFALTGNWQRLSLTWTGTAASNAFTLNTFNAVTARTIYVAAPQLEQSATVGEYIPTTSTINSAPRFDHDPATGESLGLLREEQRTNLLLRSEEFGTTWVSTRASVTANSIVAPDGSLTADKITEDTTAATTHLLTQVGTLISIVGSRYTYSVYAKADGRNWIVLSPGSTWGYAWFDISAGAVGTVIDGGGATTASITNVGNGWYRCVVSATAVDARGLQILLANANNVVTYTGNGTSGIYIWGAQLEKGAFPTSYIPTTTAAVTRSADVASITGSNFSSWYRQDEGTMFGNATTNARHAGANTFPRIASLSDGTTSNRMDLLYRVLAPYTDAGYNVVSSNVAQAAFDTNDERNGQSMAMSYAANDFAFTVGGTLANTDTAGTVPTVDRLSIGLRSGIDLRMSGTIRRVTYWPTRLSNEVLQRITQ